MSTAKAIAIIAGVGPGTGAAVAARFAKVYTVVLLARSASTLSSLVQKITQSGGEALAIPTDVSDQKSVDEAFRKVKESYPGQEVRVGVYNVAGRPKMQSFLDMTTDEWAAGFEIPNRGAFNFSQSIIPLLLASSRSTNLTASEIQYPPTLIFTGATASTKASAKFSNFTPGKFALRSLSQSIAKEFGPQGIHVGHAIIDGVINTELTKGWMAGAGPDAKVNPEAIADEYWHLHTQSRSAWSWEIEIRPYVEKW